MASSAAQMRSYQGLPLFSYGFRPFFLFGAAWAALTVAIWLPMLSGELSLPTLFMPLEWHVHELVFGYVPAIVAGFLLTAVPNWTGRLPVVGGRLQVLFGLWVAGRIAVSTSAILGAVPCAVIDLSFLLVLGAVMAREIVAAGNLRNLKVLAGVALLFAGNLLFHVGARSALGTGLGERFGISASVFLIMLIGGRIVPSFTRNWLAQRKSARLPEPFGNLDVLSIATSAVALGLWIGAPNATPTGVMAVLACLINLLRLVRWRGPVTATEPLILILHIGFCFVPIGFGLVALSILSPNVVIASGAVHGWTAGAISLMTLAVMMRATLGHTGQKLEATAATNGIYAAALIAAVARIVVAFGMARQPMLVIATVTWVAAYAGFVVVSAPLLLRARS